MWESFGAIVEAVRSGLRRRAERQRRLSPLRRDLLFAGSGGFVIGDTPIGVTADELPIGCEEIEDVGGVDHYACSGVLYRPVVRGAGSIFITVRR